jgi:hypothetical protein
MASEDNYNAFISKDKIEFIFENILEINKENIPKRDSEIVEDKLLGMFPLLLNDIYLISFYKIEKDRFYALVYNKNIDEFFIYYTSESGGNIWHLYFSFFKKDVMNLWIYKPNYSYIQGNTINFKISAKLNTLIVNEIYFKAKLYDSEPIKDRNTWKFIKYNGFLNKNYFIYKISEPEKGWDRYKISNYFNFKLTFNDYIDIINEKFDNDISDGRRKIDYILPDLKDMEVNDYYPEFFEMYGDKIVKIKRDFDEGKISKFNFEINILLYRFNIIKISNYLNHRLVKISEEILFTYPLVGSDIFKKKINDNILSLRDGYDYNRDDGNHNDLLLLFSTLYTKKIILIEIVNINCLDRELNKELTFTYLIFALLDKKEFKYEIKSIIIGITPVISDNKYGLPLEFYENENIIQKLADYKNILDYILTRKHPIEIYKKVLNIEDDGYIEGLIKTNNEAYERRTPVPVLMRQLSDQGERTEYYKTADIKPNIGLIIPYLETHNIRIHNLISNKYYYSKYLKYKQKYFELKLY